MRLYFCRHPQTSDNVYGLLSHPVEGDFTETGRLQLEQLIRRLSREHIDMIYSSDAIRCKNAAASVGNKLGIPVHYDVLLRERDNGDWSGRPKRDISTIINADINAKAPNGESIDEVNDRANRVLELFASNKALHDKNILIFSGGFLLKLIIGQTLGLQPGEAIKRLKVSNASLTVIDVLPDKQYRIECLNSRDYLIPQANRIHIFGIYGTGKSTLAQVWSDRFSIPVYSLDDIKYIKKFDIVRSVSERKQLLEDISKKPTWITEGSWGDFAESVFNSANLLVYLRLPQHISYFRALKRSLERKMNGVNCEKDSLAGIALMLYEIRQYYSGKGPVSLKSHDAIAKKYNNKTIVVKSLLQYSSLLKLKDINAI